MRARPPIVALALALAGPGVAAPAHAAPPPVRGAPAASASAPDLDVPYVAQSELLCGGAAAAMVLRYHGEHGAAAEWFAHLVRRDEGGIRTDELTRAIAARGWRVRGPDELEGSLAGLEAALRSGLPPLVLLEDAPGRWHYVVVVGMGADGVRVHDPARAPGIVLSAAEFTARWEGGRRWALLVLPRAPRAAESGDRTAAQGEASPALLLASERFRGRDWAGAAAAALAATAAAPGDPRAWRLLATSRWLADDPAGALDAWSRVGEPRIDGTRVAGLTRTRHPVVHRLLGLAPGTPLDPEGLARARRRLALLPAAAATGLAYRPLPGGWAEAEALVIEGPPHPFGAAGLAGVLAGAAAGEVHLWEAGLAGAGERLDLRWRPRAGGAVQLAAVGALGFRGRTEAGFGWLTAAPSRRSAWLRVTDWASPWLRWEAGIRLDRRREGTRAGLTGALAGAAAAGDGKRDRAAVRLGAAFWPGPSSHGLLALDATLGHGGPHARWSGALRAGARTVAGAAPADLHPTFGGSGALPLAGPFAGPDPVPALRAHAERRVRALAYGGAEGVAWTGAGPLVRLGAAVFLDAALAGASERGRRAWADAGVGVRVAVPGVPGVLRLDRAWSLAGGRGRWSVGTALEPGAALRP